MKNKLFISLLGISSSLIAQERPNVILFLVDDMGVMDTSLPFLVNQKGDAVKHPLNEWYRTPAMERLANQGIRFSTFYAQSVSSPTRTSIMTGQNATRHATTNWINAQGNNRTTYGPKEWNWEGIRKASPTLPRLLQESGYKTIHVGKAHFGCKDSEGENPCNIGFDVNIAGSGIGHPASYDGKKNYGHGTKKHSHAVPGLEKYHGTDTFLTEALTLEAKDQIDRAVEEEKPFFLYLAHYAVHAPFESDKRFIENYQNKGKKGYAPAFASLIEGMDDSLNKLMDHLVKKGIADNTLIIFLGDNGSDAPLGDMKGYASAAPLRGKKGTEYEGGVRVPFIVGWGAPNEDNKFQKQLPVATDKIQMQLGTVMDIYPTVLNLAGVKKPQTHIIDGYDLASQLKGEKSLDRSEQVLMHFPHAHNGSYFTTFRDGDWKLIYYYNPAMPNRPMYELYNLKRDPGESNNRAMVETDKLKKMVNAMSVQLEKENALYPIDKDGNQLKPFI